MTDWIRQFSLPYENFNESVFDTVITAHGVAVASWLLDKHGDEVAQASNGLVEFLQGWIENTGASKTAWDISFGRVHLALKEGNLDVVEAAIRMGVRIARSGQPGRWHAHIPATSFQIDNSVFQNVTHVEVDCDSADAPKIMFRMNDSRHIYLHRNGKNGSWIGGDGEHLESVGRNRVISLLPRQALPPDKWIGENFMECQPVMTITSEMGKSFHDGFAVLEQNAPQYIPWIERVLCGIVVCPKEIQYRLVSGSWEDVPGFVHMSSPHGGIDIAEILVHECAHQYFYMLQWVGPVDDSTDHRTYWSPPIRKERPLSRILMAYHALANVQLLYEAVRQNKANNPQDIQYVMANEPDLQAAIAALDEPLRDNPALTSLGRGLYYPLAESIAALASKTCKRFECTR